MVSHLNYVGSSTQNALGLPFGQTHMPHPRFNLFHIDNLEVHLDTLNVSIFEQSNKSMQNGLLHLCSRSIVFDGETLKTDLIKCRFNQSFEFEQLQGDQLQALINQQGNNNVSPAPLGGQNNMAKTFAHAFPVSGKNASDTALHESKSHEQQQQQQQQQYLQASAQRNNIPKSQIALDPRQQQNYSQQKDNYPPHSPNTRPSNNNQELNRVNSNSIQQQLQQRANTSSGTGSGTTGNNNRNQKVTMIKKSAGSNAFNHQTSQQSLQSQKNTQKRFATEVQQTSISPKKPQIQHQQSHRPTSQQVDKNQIYENVSTLMGGNLVNINIDDPKKKKVLKDFYSYLNKNFIGNPNNSHTSNNNNLTNSILSFNEQISEIQVLLISIKQVIKIPRQPAGPSYIDAGEGNTKFQTPETQYILFILNEEMARQNEFLYNLGLFTKPDQNNEIFYSEDDLIKKYIDSIQKRYLEFVTLQETAIHSKFLIKQVVKTITIEGEHTYIMILKNTHHHSSKNNKHVITEQQKIGDKDEEAFIELIPIMNAPHQIAQSFIFLKNLRIIQSYRYMYEYKTLRLVTWSSQKEYLIQFKTQKHHNKALEYLKRHSHNLDASFIDPNDQNNVIFYQEAWQNGRLSNGDYLLFVNFIANRSFNDLTQYPIFPWILQDYKNDKLQLNKEISFRDLSKPIGALNADKFEQFKSKYFEIINKSSALVQTNANSGFGSENEKPYMYLSHYSTPGIVLYYLIRRIPPYILKVQNEGYGGPPDRIFYDIGMSWYNGMKVLADNKEMIPEFFFGDGSFLQNQNKLELGLNHQEEKVNNVNLPQWATSYQDFILKNRQALESNYVSANLNKWIDLVFGHLQKGEKASMANNLFQTSTLDENVDFSQISSPLERQAIEAQIRNFGQCPFQIFKAHAHPEKYQRLISLGLNQISYTSPAMNEGLEQELQEARQEINRLRQEIDEVNKSNEENIQKSMQEFKVLDESRRKKITRYKEENEKTISTYKQMVEALKNKAHTGKLEIEQKFKEKEKQYIQVIEALKQQLISQNQQTNTQPQVQSKNLQQLNNFIEKHPGGIEYLKTLETNTRPASNAKGQNIVKKLDQQISNANQLRQASNSTNNSTNFMSVGANINSQIISTSKLKNIKAHVNNQ